MTQNEFRPLRILHTEASTGWGGQEMRILDESAGLRSRGHDVQIAAPSASPILTAAERRRIPTHRIALDRRRPTSLVALSRLVRQFKPDVIVTHSSSDSWAGAIATRISGADATIVRMRHLSTPVAAGPLNRWLYGKVPARVVTTGEAIRKHLIDKLGLRADAIVSVPTGANFSRFRPGDRRAARLNLGLTHDEPIVGIVATLRTWKGHSFLMSAMNDPRLAHARLLMVGDGPNVEPLREQFAQSPARARIVFAGQQDDVVPWLQAFDVFALPSTGNEGVPQALVQAMATGLPVVTTGVGAISELVRDGVTGLIVPPEDASALAEAIARLLSDKELARRLGEAGRAHVTASFSADTMLDRMEAIYRQAAHRPAPGHTAR